LTGCRGVPGDVGCDDDYEDDDREGGDALVGHRSSEDVDERISSWIRESVVNAVDREQVGDQENDSHDAVGNVTPEDGDGNISACISDFLRNVGSCIGTWFLSINNIQSSNRIIPSKE